MAATRTKGLRLRPGAFVSGRPAVQNVQEYSFAVLLDFAMAPGQRAYFEPLGSDLQFYSFILKIQIPSFPAFAARLGRILRRRAL
ncbi:MAG TPA: hypothetical protein VGR47_21175, partial [Terracidiphilus sp.]|nr:hypothetical protein [Terracidiphilus sp.]